MVYRFVSLQSKISSKGNRYGVLNVIDLNSIVFKSYIYDPLLSRVESFGFGFGDCVNIECNLNGIVSIDSYEG